MEAAILGLPAFCASNKDWHLLTRQFEDGARPPFHVGLWPSSSKLVGVISPHYNLARVSYGLPVEGYDFVRVPRLPLHRFTKSTFVKYTPLVLDRSTSLVHTWNEIPVFGDFVVSFEYELPRYFGHVAPWQESFARSALSSDRCGAILALTEVAARYLTKRFHEQGLSKAAGKIEVFRGAVPQGATRAQKISAGPFQIVFVGRHAYRKGIVPLLEALRELADEGLELRLTIFGDLAAQPDYVHRDILANEVLAREIAKSSWVEVVGLAPQNAVRARLRSADLLILPTLDDSLGWATVEAAAEGVPVLTTNVLNLGDVVEANGLGWTIPLPTNSDGRWTGIDQTGATLRKAIAAAYETLRKGIVEQVAQLAGDRALLLRTGLQAQKWARENYDPATAGRALAAIYDRALS